MTAPVWETDGAKRIFETLDSGRAYTLDRIPGGSGIDSPLLETFVTDIEMVLEKTKWVCALEVHSDLTGSTAANVKVTQKRADLLATLINTDLQRRATLPYGKGNSEPVFAQEDSDLKRSCNRRVIVRRLGAR